VLDENETNQKKKKQKQRSKHFSCFYTTTLKQICFALHCCVKIFLVLVMSSFKAGVEPLSIVESDITDVKRNIDNLEEEKRELKSKITAFENDKSPKDEISRNGNLEDKKRLTALENRLAGLEARRDRLEAQALAPPQPQQAQGK
jgi:cell division protein FtsB